MEYFIAHYAGDSEALWAIRYLSFIFLNETKETYIPVSTVVVALPHLLPYKRRFHTADVTALPTRNLAGKYTETN